MSEDSLDLSVARVLRVYPPRYRRARGDELGDVVRDLLPPGAERVPRRVAWDLLVSGVRFRLRDRPPVLRRWAYRWFDARLPQRWAQWVRDDIDHWSYPLRRARLGLFASAWHQRGGLQRRRPVRAADAFPDRDDAGVLAGVGQVTQLVGEPDQRIATLRTVGGSRLSTSEPTATEDTILAALRHQLRTQQAQHERQLDKLKTAIKERDKALAAAHGEIRRLKGSSR